MIATDVGVKRMHSYQGGLIALVLFLLLTACAAKNGPDAGTVPDRPDATAVDMSAGEDLSRDIVSANSLEEFKALGTSRRAAGTRGFMAAWSGDRLLRGPRFSDQIYPRRSP